MYVFRVREYKADHGNTNTPPMKLEATTEHRAANFAYMKDEGWIYFFVDLTAPESL
jgi:hypothetical protein